MKTLRYFALLVSMAALPAAGPGATAPGSPRAPAPEPEKAAETARAGTPAARSVSEPAPKSVSEPAPTAAKDAAVNPVTPPATAAKDAAVNPVTPLAAAKAPVNPALSPRFLQVRERVDALFRYRNGMSPPPDPRLNPFRPPGSAPAAAPSPASKPDPLAGGSIPAPLSSDLELLQQAVATLKVSGVLETAGRSHLVINTKSYKIGEVVQTKVKGESVFLRVRNISRNSVTLGLNGAEMTLKF